MFLRPGGYAVLSDPDAGVVEFDTSTCSHCGNVTHVKPKMRAEDMGGFCYGCSKPVCSKCVGFGCDVIEKKMERMEAEDRAWRSYGI